MNQQRTVIVVCPPISVGQAFDAPISPLAAGFAQARRLLDAGEIVHLVADGCTIAAARPAWADAEQRLTTRELGDYREGHPIAATRKLADDLRGWLDLRFGPATRALEISAGLVFFASMVGRSLQPLFDAVPFVQGLARAFPSSRFITVGPPWQGTPLLQALLAPTGGRVHQDSVRRPPLWPISFVLSFALLLGRSWAGQVINYLRSRHARRFLAGRAAGTGARPAIWLALVPDWKRINDHVMERIGRPLLALGQPVGILLVNTLAPGERTGAAGGQTESAGAPWPFIDELAHEHPCIRFEQLVRPVSAVSFLKAMLSGTATSLRVGWRIMRGGRIASLGGFRIDLSGIERTLASLATADVLQLSAVSAAFAQVAQRQDFTGTKVVFASVGLVDTATADRLLHRAGATTVNYVHGAMGDSWYGQNENCSDYMMVWTEADLDSARCQGARGVLLPFVSTSPQLRRPGAPRNILFITNHLHHGWSGARFPLRPFLQEILGCREVIDEIDPGRFSFRWRPHPSDVPEEIARMSQEFPCMALSEATSLAEDIGWADVVVMSPSTTLLEALAGDKPVFLHTVPGMRHLPEVLAADPRRLFFHARDLAEPFAQLVTALDAGDDAALEPERHLYAALVGTLEQPEDIGAFLTGLGNMAGSVADGEVGD